MSSIEFFRAQNARGRIVAEWRKHGGYVVTGTFEGAALKEHFYAFEEKAVAAAKRKAKRLGIKEERAMKTPTYDELLQTVTSIASMKMDGDQFEANGIEVEYEMTIDEAFGTAFDAISMCRDALGTDGSDLPIPNTEKQSAC